MENKLKQVKKNIVITGCSTGIGFDAAVALSKRDYRVIATVRKESDAVQLKAQGVEDVVLLDLSDADSVQLAADQIKKLCKDGLYALFNNGAYGQAGFVEDLTRPALEKQFAANVFGTHQLTRALLPLLLEQEDARLIQNSSVLGFVTLPGRGAYNASKFALEGLTDTLRLELRGCPVKISIIEPGPIATDFRKNSLKALQENVDIESSRQRERYHASIERLSKPGPAAPFTLESSAVTEKLIHALEARFPRRRYYVTFPTYLFAVLKRILPTFVLDKLLISVGQG